MKKLLFFILSGSLFFSAANKSKKPFEGTVNYAFNYHLGPGTLKTPDAFTLHIKGSKVCVTIEPTFGSVRTLTDTRTEDVVSLYTIEGRKYIVRSKRGPPVLTKQKMTFYKDSVRTFNGYTCRKALLRDGQCTRAIWYAENILLSSDVCRVPPSLSYNILGLHMEMKGKLILYSDCYEQSDHTTTFVKKIEEKTVDDSEFSFDDKLYQEATIDEVSRIIRASFR